MTTNHQTAKSDWSGALRNLKCLRCGSHQMQPAGDDAIECADCQHTSSIRDEILMVMENLMGNNEISADFYDSPLWKKYRFWKRFTPFNERSVRRWRSEVLQHLPNLAGTRLLDIAIGAGLNLPYISDACEVYGIDISIEQLLDCRRGFPERSVRLIYGEAERLPFQDNTFDNVLSFGAFNYFNDPLKSLREMARVVKPEGKIVITDEYADLPNRMIGHKIGWPALDHWILSKFLHLGDDFTDMMDRHLDLKIEPIMDQALHDWSLTNVCREMAYCVVGHPQKLDP